MELGILGDAEIYYKKSLSINQRSYLALYNLGIVNKKNGDLQTAESFGIEMNLLPLGPKATATPEVERESE